MGKILKIQNKTNEKVEITLEMTQSEAESLSGNLDGMHLFSEKNLTFKTRLVQRGKRNSTKYFLMPKEFRKDIMISNTIPCSRIETKTKYIYLFLVNKIPLENEQNQEN